jgi:hypothetical protein
MYRIIRFALTARKNVDGVRRFAVKWRRFKRPETRSDLRLCPHNRRLMMMNQADTRSERSNHDRRSRISLYQGCLAPRCNRVIACLMSLALKDLAYMKPAT